MIGLRYRPSPVRSNAHSARIARSTPNAKVLTVDDSLIDAIIDAAADREQRGPSGLSERGRQ